jgi:hypothetical protein
MQSGAVLEWGTEVDIRSSKGGAKRMEIIA